MKNVKLVVKSFFLILVVAFGVASSTARAQNDLVKLVDPAEPMWGKWRLVEFRNVDVEMPPNCFESITELRSDHSFTTVNGNQVVYGFYVVQTLPEGIQLVQQITAHNGGVNCDGMTPEETIGNDSPSVYVEVEERQMLVYFAPDRSGIHMVLAKQE